MFKQARAKPGAKLIGGWDKPCLLFERKPWSIKQESHLHMESRDLDVAPSKQARVNVNKRQL